MNSFIDGKPDFRLISWLILSFIAFTVIGTLSHELGHWTAAEIMGYNAMINYQSTWLVPADIRMELSHQVWFTMGGPLQTMLTGTIGLILLLVFRNSFNGQNRLASWQWLIILMTLFWLRQTTNLFMWLVGYLLHGKFSMRMDEVRLSHYFFGNGWLLIIITGSIGLLICTWVLIRRIPSGQRLGFLIGGAIGGVAGYFLWLVVFGKLILP